MHSVPTPSHPIEMLMAGPRGRRFLLEYALASESIYRPVRDEGSFGFAVVQAAQTLAPRRRRKMSLVGSNVGELRSVGITLSEVAARLERVELHASQDVIRLALTSATDRGKYWESPDGEDLLAATDDLRSALRQVAEHVTASGFTSWWYSPIEKERQQVVTWTGVLPPVLREPTSILHQLCVMQRAPGFPSPPRVMPSSTRSLADGSPAGLWFVEDNLGELRAESIRLTVLDEPSVFEIASAVDWAELCVRYPLEYAESGDGAGRSSLHNRANRLVVPDWVRVAEKYHGVHLQVGAYLAASALPIDAGNALSVVAGWNPDETLWLSSAVSYSGERTQWVLEENGTNMVWVKAS